MKQNLFKFSLNEKDSVSLATAPALSFTNILRTASLARMCTLELLCVYTYLSGQTFGLGPLTAYLNFLIKKKSHIWFLSIAPVHRRSSIFHLAEQNQACANIANTFRQSASDTVCQIGERESLLFVPLTIC